MKKDLLVSIITPVFNSRAFIESCYISLVNQTFETWEWILIDDCSSDDSIHCIEKIAKEDSRIRFIKSDRNVGPGLARNLGFAKADGDFISFLDIDDEWEPSKLERQITMMVENQWMFSFTAYWICNAALQKQKSVDIRTINSVSYRDLLKKKVTMLCSSVVIDRSLVGDGMLGLRSGQDYAFWLAILKKGQVAHKIPEPLTLYRTGLASVSSNCSNC